MIAGLYTGSSAMTAFETSLNNTSNNIANVNTPGFKRSIVDFQDLVYTGRDGQQIGRGTSAAAITTRDFRQGREIVTDNATDLFIGGEGFFEVQLPGGALAYTRDGAFEVDAQGRLVTEDGYIVQPPVTFPADTISFTIGFDGSVNALTAASPETPVQIGQVQLNRFVNPAGLRSFGRNLAEPTAASGAALTGTPGQGVFGEIRQGVLEGSNVEVVEELSDLITAQRAFEVNSRVVLTSIEMLQTAYEIIR